MTVCVVLALGTVAPSALADTLTITPPSSASAETTVPITVSGDSASFTPMIELYALSGVSACPTWLDASTKYSSSPHTVVVAPFGVSARPFSVTAGLSIPQPGAYLLCGFLNMFTGASASMTVAASAREISEQEAARAGEQAARAREATEHAPATLLAVRVASARGHPGHTTITITASPYAYVFLTIEHGGETKQWRQGATPASRRFTVSWSCRYPRRRYRYWVRSSGGSGPPLSRTGHFRALVSTKWCRAAARKEQEFSRRIAADEERQRKHFEHNCRAIGGSPITIRTGEGTQIVCHSKSGGVIEVPT